METRYDAQGRRVPASFRRAVTQFADELGVEAEPLIEGSALELDGRKFWFMHYGDDDPEGVTILMDVGEPPSSPQAQLAMTTPLLEYHMAFPVAHGYYGWIPGLNCLVHCTRIALDEVEDVAQAIAETIDRAQDAMRLVQAEIDSGGAAKPSFADALDIHHGVLADSMHHRNSLEAS